VEQGLKVRASAGAAGMTMLVATKV
jgi:hypothetical protein